MTNTFELLTDLEMHGIDNIYRFNKQPVIRNETLSQHSWWVNFFALNLFAEMFHYTYDRDEDVLKVLKLNLQVLKYAPLHDILETITGDVNHDLKYNSYNGNELKKVLVDYEGHIEKQFAKSHRKNIANAINTPDEFVVRLVKVCDWLALIKNIQQEVNLGNKNMLNIILKTKIKTDAAIDALIFGSRVLNNALPKAATVRHILCDVDVVERLRLEINQMSI